MIDADDLDEIATPSCPACLVTLVLDDERTAWRCPECGLVRL